MRALTLWQPWAAAVAHCDKPVENRTWHAPRCAIGERIAIHAAKRIAWVYEQACVRAFPTAAQEILAAKYGRSVLLAPTPLLPRAVIVCTAVLARCVRIGDGDPIEQSEWFAGPFGWVLEDVRTLPEPIPCRGGQGVWIVPAHVEAAVRAAEGGSPRASRRGTEPVPRRTPRPQGRRPNEWDEDLRVQEWPEVNRE